MNSKIEHTEEIQELFKEEQNRNFERPVSGFYKSQSEFNGTSVEQEIQNFHQ